MITSENMYFKPLSKGQALKKNVFFIVCVFFLSYNLFAAPVWVTNGTNTEWDSYNYGMVLTVCANEDASGISHTFFGDNNSVDGNYGYNYGSLDVDYTLVARINDINDYVALGVVYQDYIEINLCYDGMCSQNLSSADENREKLTVNGLYGEYSWNSNAFDGYDSEFIQEYHFQIFPILTIKSYSSKLICDDYLTLTIAPKDANYPNSSKVYGKYEENVEFIVQYRQVGDDDWVDLDTYNLRDDRTVDISFTSLGNLSLYGKELEFRIKQDFSDCDFPDYESETVSQVFFIEKPDLGIQVNEVNCSYEKPSVVLSNFPENDGDTKLLITVSKLSSDPLYIDQPVFKNILGIDYYWNDGSTFNESIDPSVTSYSIDSESIDDENFVFGDGTYGMTVYYNDSNIEGLCGIDTFFVIHTPDPIDYTITKSIFTSSSGTEYNAKSSSGSGAKINIQNISGGNGNYKVKLDGGNPILLGDGNTSYTFSSSLSSGSHKVYVYDTNNCAESSVYAGDDVILTFPDPINITSFTQTQPQCHSNNDYSSNSSLSKGSVTFSVFGGIEDYDAYVIKKEGDDGLYSEYASSVTEEFTGLEPGNYKIYVTDKEDVQAVSELITITSPAEMTIHKDDCIVSDIICSNNNDKGFIDVVSVKNYNGSLTYSNSQEGTFTSGSIVSFSSSGDQTVWVKDVEGCMASVTKNISSAPTLSVSEKATTDPYCTSSIDGSVTLTVAGGDNADNDYKLTLYKQSNSNEIDTKTIAKGSNRGDFTFNSGIIPDTYNAKVSYDYIYYDGSLKTCSASVSNITVGSKESDLNVDIETSQGVSCSGKSDGEIKLTISGGLSPYTIMYNNGDILVSEYSKSEFIDTGLSEGTYYYKVIDAYGCNVIASNTLAVRDDPTSFLTDYPSSSAASCSTASNGEINFKLSGGIGAYNFTLSDESITPEYFESTGLYTILNKAPGTYTLAVVDRVGCQISEEITIGANGNPIIISDISATSESCGGTSDGALEIIASSSDARSGTLSYSLNGEIGDDHIFEGLSKGVYTVKVEDELGCFKTTTNSVESLNHTPYPTIVYADSLACESASNGALTITLDGYEDNEDMLYRIDLKDEEGNEAKSIENDFFLSVSSLTKQNYSLTVVDEDGCTYTDTIQIPVIETPVTLSIDKTIDASCTTASNGIIEVSAMGSMPNANYTFSLSGVDSYEESSIGEEGDAYQFSSLPFASVVTITVSDNYNCSFTSNEYTVGSDSEVFKISSTSLIDASCPNYNDGEALPIYENADYSSFNLIIQKANESDVYDTYTYAKAEIANTESITGLGAGMYQITLTDDNNCSASTRFSINEPEAVSLRFNNNLIVDKGEATGYVEIDVTGGNDNFNWELYEPESRMGTCTNSETFRIDSLIAGDYTLRLQDEHECNYEGFTDSWYTHEFTISEPEESLTLNYEIDSVNCNGEQNGKIAWFATGGWGDYTYYFNDVEDSDGNRSALLAGDYTVKIEDKEGAYREETVTVYQPEILSFNIIDTTDLVNASCPGSHNGLASFTINNGILLPNDSLKLWASLSGSSDVLLEQYAANTDTFVGLSQGSYYLHVSDRNGCKAQSNLISINEPEAPEFLLDYNYILAKGDDMGYINAEILNGNQDFYYEWFNTDSNELLSQGRTNSLTGINELVAGNYLLRVKDTAECIYEADAWMEREIKILEPEQVLSFKVDTNVAVSCNGLSDGWFRLQPVGGWGEDYLYGFTNVHSDMTSDSIFSGLVADEYTVYITDTVGVTYSSNIVVHEPEVLKAQVDSIQDVNCYSEENGYIRLSVEGGNLSYWVSTDSSTWISGTTLSELKANTYPIYIKDTQECTIQIDSVTINEPMDIVLTDTIIRISKCKQNSGRIDVSIEGGVPHYTYLWENDSIDSEDYTSNVIDSIYSGTYHLTVTDGHLCSKEYTFYVSDLTNLNIDSVVTEEVSCWGYSDGNAMVYGSQGTAPYLYAWDERLEQVNEAYNSGMSSGTYMVGLLDSEGCKAYEDFCVGTPDSLGYDIVELENPLCLGGRSGYINLNITGGTPEYQLSWSTGSTSNLLEDIYPGHYQLTITDNHDCVNNFDFNFDYQRTIKPTLGLDTMICHYETLHINPGEFVTYDWTSNENFKSTHQIPDIVDPATYYLKVIDGDNCLGYDTLKVDVSYLDITDIAITDVTCHGDADGEVELFYKSGYGAPTITWPSGIGTSTWSQVSGGDYQVNLSDEHGCVDSMNFSVYEPEPLSLETQLLVDPYCFGVPDGQIKVQGYGGRGGYKYQWSNGDNDRNNTKLDTGYYHLSYWDKLGCKDVKSYSLNYQTAIYPQLGEDVVICDGNDYFLYPGDFIEYHWSADSYNLSSTDTALVTEVPGIYYVEVMDEDYCIGRDTMEISWRDAEINPAFLVSSTVGVGDTVYMVEVSQPIPDRFEWNIGGTYEIVEQGTYYIKVIFNEIGVFDVGVDTYLDGCLAQERKKIVVVAADEMISSEGDLSTEPMQVLTFSASPNPATSYFQANVELTEVLPVTFYVVNISTGVIIERRNVSGLDTYTEGFYVPNTKSVLLLFIIVEGERHSLKIIAGE